MNLTGILKGVEGGPDNYSSVLVMEMIRITHAQELVATVII